MKYPLEWHRQAQSTIHYQQATFGLFLATVVGAVLSLVSGLIMATVGSFIATLVMTAIGFMVGAYFLFEIRSHFVRTANANKKPATKKKA